MSVVQGARSSPSKGDNAEPNAASTRFPNSHIPTITKRRPSAETSRTKQHIGQHLGSGREPVQTISHVTAASSPLGDSISPLRMEHGGHVAQGQAAALVAGGH